MEHGAKRQLQPAVELAFHYARAIARKDGEESVPRAVRPLLAVPKLPTGAFDAVVAAIDADDSFRLRFVETIEPQDVGPVGWAWLARNDGWQELLASAGVDAASAARTAKAEAEARSLQVRVDQLEQARQVALARAQRAESESARLVDDVERAVAARRIAEDESTALNAQVRDLTSRAGAAEQRATRAEAALGKERKRLAATMPAAMPEEGVEPEVVTPRRRVAIRSARGLSDDSLDGFRELLALRGVRVLVDGYNVAMLGWPLLALREQRARLVSALANYAARSAVTFDVVFDGDDFVVADRTSTSPAVRVAWSPTGVTADDVIVETAFRLDPDVGVVAVTDDAELRERLAALGCNIVGSHVLVLLVA